jgi:hypothetical protein
MALSLAAPKEQSQNHFAERTWQTIDSMAHSILVHSRQPDTFWHQAIMYSVEIFNILPVKHLVDEGGTPTTPSQLFLGTKPMLSHFCVLGCPAVAKKWVTHIDNKSVNKQTESGISGIFLGFPYQQKGYLLYAPVTCQIVP